MSETHSGTEFYVNIMQPLCVYINSYVPVITYVCYWITKTCAAF